MSEIPGTNNKANKAFPQFEEVKKGIIEKKSKCIASYETYLLYKNYPLNEKVKDLYFNNFTSKVISLWLDVRSFVRDWKDYQFLEGIWNEIKEDCEIDKIDWIEFFEKIDEFVFDVGITDVTFKSYNVEESDEDV